MSRKPTSVLANNPLDLVLGGALEQPQPATPSPAEPTQTASATPSLTPPPRAATSNSEEESRAGSTNTSAQPPNHIAAVSTLGTRRAEENLQSLERSRPASPDAPSPPLKPELTRSSSRRARSAVTETASLRHRVGTMKAPYTRADGTLVRQWAITLPVDVVKRMTHRAVDMGIKPADLVLQVLEDYLDTNQKRRQ